MLKGIDHLVIVVNDLDQAAKDYERLGFTVVPGGRHPVGSHNVLISFADGSYIEIISFYRESPDHRWWNPLQQGEGLVDFCMQTDDLTGDTHKLRAAGVEIKDPVPWSRTRPDGYELKWLLSLAQGAHRGVAPFLIQDITPRQERIPQDFAHQNGATGIGTVTLAVEDPATTQRWYSAILRQDGNPIESKELQAKGYRFTAGHHVFDFLRPAGAGTRFFEWLQARGSSPYSATLRSQSGERRQLEPSLTHGARLTFE